MDMQVASADHDSCHARHSPALQKTSWCLGKLGDRSERRESPWLNVLGERSESREYLSVLRRGILVKLVSC